ncbi:MAG: ArsR family transcriptional regulator [Planctomycetota bacterium]
MAERISADAVRRKMDAGEDLLLVCAYDDEQRCADVGAEEALTSPQLRARLGQVPKDKEIVFFRA